MVDPHDDRMIKNYDRKNATLKGQNRAKNSEKLARQPQRGPEQTARRTI
jgi:hypothetical protein